MTKVLHLIRDIMVNSYDATNMPENRNELAAYVMNYFARRNPKPETELIYESPYQLAVAVILSAQCTDKRVNLVTPTFFEHFPTPQDLAQAPFEEVYQLIKSVSYPNNKSKNLIGMAKILVDKFNGILPQTVEELTELPGVGRKTANVLVSVLYDTPAMAVDTHVFRVSNRIGLIEASNPLQAEKQLVEIIPEELLPKAHHWLILHGRYICKARKPECKQCGLTGVCHHYHEEGLFFYEDGIPERIEKEVKNILHDDHPYEN